MSESVKKASTSNELARERNRAAADRTLMAWIRTAIAMNESIIRNMFIRRRALCR